MPSPLDVYRLGHRLRDRAFAAAVRGSFGAWGERTIVRVPLRVEGERRIRLGAAVFIGEGSWLQTLEEGEIDIGDGCEFSGLAVISAAQSIVIERDVLMARNVHVLDHIHRFDQIDVPVHAQGISEPDPVRIREGAWIGANVVVMPGVTIGRQAVVGANSIVRCDVPDRTVAVGAPARALRRIDDAAHARGLDAGESGVLAA
jgi:acetyltransferase-like isoleucine patch superfamily enzyme